MNSLRNKLWLGFGGLLFILLVVSLLTLIVFTRYSHALERVFRDNYDSALWCNAIKDSLDELDARAQRTIWQHPDGVEAVPKDVFDRLETSLQLQLSNCNLPGEAERTTHLAELWKQYRAFFEQFDADPASRRDLYSQHLLSLNHDLKDTARAVATMNMSSMVAIDGQAKRTLIAVRNALIILVSAGSLLAALLVGTIGAALKRPLGELERSARQIAAGDLDLNIDVKSKDEIGRLAEAFKIMTAQLREFRKSDREKLVRTQQTTQLAIDSLPDAVFVLDADGTTEIANRSAQQHFQILPGKKIDPLRLPWLNELFGDVTRSKGAIDPQGYRSAVQLFDQGNERFLLPRAVPMLSEDDSLLGVTVILVDVTRLRQIDEAKSGMVSTVSHELRTPLTSVRVAVSLMLSGKLGELSPQQQKLLGAAEEDVERLRSIIDNLLSISRMEAGKTRFDLRPTSATEIVTQAEAPLLAQLRERRITVRKQIAEDLPMVRADASGITTALGNLLSNATKFSPSGGDIRLAVTVAGDRNVTFAVTDDGPGIPPEFRDRVFERFFRVPRPDGPSGAGLGLAIARDIVEAHGGTIAVAGDRGCTVRITLPSA